MKQEIKLNDIVHVSDSVKYRARTDLTDIYLKEAERQTARAKNNFNNTKSTNDKIRNKALWHEKQGSLFAILLSVFALESHINRIGHDNLKKNQWEKLERKSIKKKWIEFPHLISGNKFDEKTELFKNFEIIIELRNKLVHYKDYDFKEFVKHPCGIKVAGIYEYVNVVNAELAYNTANEMMKELGNLLKK